MANRRASLRRLPDAMLDHNTREFFRGETSPAGIVFLSNMFLWMSAQQTKGLIRMHPPVGRDLCQLDYVLQSRALRPPVRFSVCRGSSGRYVANRLRVSRWINEGLP